LLTWFCVALILVSGCFRSDRLRLESPGQPERFIQLEKARTFSLRYKHSVEQTPVVETFQILDNGKLMLISTAYQSYGVGLPSLPEEGTLTVSDGWLILKDLHRLYPDIRLRVGSEAAVSLEVDKKMYPIYQWYPPGSLVIITK